MSAGDIFERDADRRIAELEQHNENLVQLRLSDRKILEAENQRLREGIMGCAVEINHLTGPHENSLRAVSTKLAALLREGE